MKPSNTSQDLRIANEIVSVLPAGSCVLVTADREHVRFAVKSPELKLSTVTLRRKSLDRLATDPARDIKVEYLQRDLLRSARHRADFKYPHTLRVTRVPRRAAAAAARALAAAMPGLI